MKVTEILTEAKSSELLNVVLATLEAQAKKHGGKAQDKTSYSLGGNFSAVISGDVKVRKEFASYNYNMPTRWDAILEIGNNIKGAKGLDVAREVFDIVMNDLSDFGTEVTIDDRHDKHNVVVTMGDDRINVCCEYARAFCWVGVRVLS